MGGNPITEIPARWLDNAIKLTHCTLAGNLITAIPPNWLRKIKQLNLFENAITAIPENWLKGIEELLKVYVVMGGSPQCICFEVQYVLNKCGTLGFLSRVCGSLAAGDCMKIRSHQFQTHGWIMPTSYLFCMYQTSRTAAAAGFSEQALFQ